MIPRLLVDLSSIIQVYTHLEGEYSETITVDGNKFIIPDPQEVKEHFTKELFDVLDRFDLTPREVILVKDPVDSRKKRVNIYPDYKGKRTKRPDEYYEAFNKILDEVVELVMDFGGIMASPPPGYEADDLLNELSHRLSDSIIWTRDHDMLATGGLVFIKNELNPDKFPVTKPAHIRLYKALVGDTSDNVPGCVGFGKKAFADLLEIFGESGLDALVGLFENKQLERLEEDVHELLVLEKVVAQAEALYRYWNVVGFLPIKSREVRWSVGMAKKGQKTSSEFNQWMPHEELITADKLTEDFKRKFRSWATNSRYVALDIETDVPEESHAWLEQNGGSVDVYASELCGLSVTFTNNTSLYFPVDHADTDNCTPEQVRKLLELIPQEIHIVCHNGVAFELPVLFNAWGKDQLSNGWYGYLPNMVDTKLAASYYDENQKSHLKGLSKRILKYSQASYKETVGDKSGMREVTGVDVVDYGIDDTITTSALWNFFMVFMEYEGTFDTFMKVEQHAAYVTAKVFNDGCSIDLDRLKELQDEDNKELEKLREDFELFLVSNHYPGTEFTAYDSITPRAVKEVYHLITGNPLMTQVRRPDKLAELLEQEQAELSAAVLVEDIHEFNRIYRDNWEPISNFNFRSPGQVSRLLYDWMELPKRVFNSPTAAARKKGNFQGSVATGEPALLSAIAHNDSGRYDVETSKYIIELILKMKELATRESLFYSKLPGFVHWKTGKIHPQLWQCGTTSRRFAPSKPNLNQLPKRGEGKKVRSAFIPHKKKARIVTLDISGEELRLIAEASQCPVMLSCYIGDELKDVHSLTGLGVCLKRGAEWTEYPEYQAMVEKEDPLAKEYRTLGKKVNFTAQYLCMAPKLSQTLLIPESDAQSFLDSRLETYPGVAAYEKAYVEEIKEKGYAETFLGGRRHLYKQLAAGGYIGGKAERSGYNFRIQGSAAEVLKLIFGAMWRSGILFKYDIRFYFPVHDECVFSVADDDLDEFITEFHPMMIQQYADMKVPLMSDAKTGPNFGDLEGYKLAA